jgi:(p)ppGpp synthase/HD superfamily hydrolase
MRTNHLEAAIKIACDAHEFQVDKGGKPYILHPLAVMARAQTEDEQIVAVLHDVLEDSTYMVDDLINADFPMHIAKAVAAITRRKDESYMDFIKRLCENDLARQVKIYDLQENMDLSRLKVITDEDIKRREKYIKALKYITEFGMGSIQ